MLFSFLSYHIVILQLALLVENVKNMFSIFRVIVILFHFKSQSLEKQPGFETSRCVKAEYLNELK